MGLVVEAVPAGRSRNLEFTFRVFAERAFGLLVHFKLLQENPLGFKVFRVASFPSSGVVARGYSHDGYDMPLVLFCVHGKLRSTVFNLEVAIERQAVAQCSFAEIMCWWSSCLPGMARKKTGLGEGGNS